MRKSIDWFLYEGNTGIYWIKILRINPSRLDAGRREEINLNFISHFLVVPQKVLWRP